MMFVFCRATKGTEMWQVEEVGPLCLLRNTLGELQRQSGNKYGKQPQTLHLKWPNYMATYLVRRTEIWKKIWRQMEHSHISSHSQICEFSLFVIISTKHHGLYDRRNNFYVD
jgi:hypothetical protein